MARGSLGIAGVSLEYRWKCVSCLALFCFVVLVLLIVTTAAGSAGRTAAVVAYLPTTEAHAAVVTGRAIGVATALHT